MNRIPALGIGAADDARGVLERKGSRHWNAELRAGRRLREGGGWVFLRRSWSVGIIFNR